MAKSILTPQMFKEAAIQRGFKVGSLDKPYSQAFYISDGNKQFICAQKSTFGLYPLNTKFAEYLADSKAMTKRVLKNFGFRVIKGKQFYISVPDGKILAKDKPAAAIAYAEKLRYPVFVKPDSGSQGNNAKIIFSNTGLRTHIKKMKADEASSFLVEKFTEYPEFRIFVVAGKVQFMYRKKRMSVVGNGTHTVRELVQMMRHEVDEEVMKKMLKKHGQTDKSVLPENMEVTLQETANISTGAEIVDYRDKVPKQVHVWAKELYKITGLEVFGVDVFAKKGWDNPEEYLIIEVNSNPSLIGLYKSGRKEKALQICNLIMDRFFAKRIVR